ncbi:MAG: acyl-CoA-binding protein [Candidatus Helarchaeota archaeon]
MSEEVDEAIKSEFEKAVEYSKKLPKQPTDIQLELYGLYKQATIGNVQGERPGRMKVRARAKFDAWASRKGMLKEVAMKEYIKKIAELEEISK